MARFLRTETNSSGGHTRLGAPEAVGGAITFDGPRVRLVDPLSGNLLSRRRARAFLRPPAVVAAAAVLPRPVHVQLADVEDRVAHNLRQRRSSHLFIRPIVVDAAVAPLGSVAAQLAASRRGTPRSVLRPAAVVSAPAVFTGPTVALAPKVPKRTVYRLSAPTSVGGAITFDGPRVRLADPLDPNGLRRRKPSYQLGRPSVLAAFVAAPVAVTLAPSAGQPRRTLSRLRPPEAIDLTPQTQFVAVTLASARRGAPKSVLRVPAAAVSFVARPTKVALARIRPARNVWLLRRPADIVDRDDVGVLRVRLAYSLRGKPKPRLSAPAVVAPVLARRILEVLAPQRRGVPRSRLFAPAVVGPVLARSIDVTLARIRPARTAAVLRRPTDLVDQQDLGFVRARLAYSVRGRPKSQLSEPAVVAPVLARPLEVSLARIRPARTVALLRRPADLVDRDDLGFTRTHLAYSLRGRPRSQLSEPTVVGPVLARPVEVTLTRILPARTNPVLRKPADLVDQQDLGVVRAHLAYSLRGKPKPTLRPPTVVAPVLARAIEVVLARIRPVRTFADLRAPVVIDLSPQTKYLAVTLAPSRFPRPKSVLREPPKGTPQPAPIYPVSVTLAPQSRGKAKPILRQTVYAARVYAPIRVELAPSRFPRPKSRLLGVVYGARVYAPVATTLAPSRRGSPRSVLRAPAAVGRFVAAPASVTLAPGVRGRPASFLSPPALLPELARKPGFSLARIRPPRVRSLLRAPTTVAQPFVARAVKESFARVRPRRTIWMLQPPTIVEAPRAVFFGPAVTLTYSLRGKPRFVLSGPSILQIECFGRVVGFDSGPLVCGETSGAPAVGATSGAAAAGSVSGGTAAGATESAGIVSGGDEQREGCD